jgi:hypothetical protein
VSKTLSACSAQTVDEQHPKICIPTAGFPHTWHTLSSGNLVMVPLVSPKCSGPADPIHKREPDRFFLHGTQTGIVLENSPAIRIFMDISSGQVNI